MGTMNLSKLNNFPHYRGNYNSHALDCMSLISILLLKNCKKTIKRMHFLLNQQIEVLDVVDILALVFRTIQNQFKSLICKLAA